MLHIKSPHLQYYYNIRRNVQHAVLLCLYLFGKKQQQKLCKIYRTHTHMSHTPHSTLTAASTAPSCYQIIIFHNVLSIYKQDESAQLWENKRKKNT